VAPCDSASPSAPGRALSSDEMPTTIAHEREQRFLRYLRFSVVNPEAFRPGDDGRVRGRPPRPTQ
jgi:hypothetical protein